MSRAAGLIFHPESELKDVHNGPAAVRSGFRICVRITDWRLDGLKTGVFGTVFHIESVNQLESDLSINECFSDPEP